MTPIQQITEEQFATLTRQWKQKRGSPLPDRGTATDAVDVSWTAVEGAVRYATYQAFAIPLSELSSPNEHTVNVEAVTGPSPVADAIRSGTINRILSLEGTLQSIMAMGNRSRQTGDYRTAVKRIVGLAHEALGLPPKW
jgi:hypothetical protein